MKLKKRILRNTMIAGLVISLLISGKEPYHLSEAMGNNGLSQVYGAEKTETVYLKTPQDLLDLAGVCHEDSYSRNLRVVLQNDIDLRNSEFTGIPIFNGSFDGGGFTVSGYTYGGDGFVTGFFRYVGEEGVIANLKLEAEIVTSEKQQCTGALAGINQGIIKDCTVSGSVSGYEETGAVCGINQEGGKLLRCRNKGLVMGYYYTGGITGKNFGVVSRCVNEGSINDNLTWIRGDDEMNSDLMSNLTGRSLEDTISLQSGVDTGGICGYSQGTLVSCTNEGTVGYAHAGYNIGGIVGRQCGFITSCSNKGHVYGKKDVGGICGQSEPFIETDPGRSMKSSAEKLNAQIDAAIADAQDASAEALQQLTRLQEYSQKVLDTTSEMTDQASTYVDEGIDKANKVIETVSENDITTQEGYDKTKKQAEDALKRLEKQAEEDAKKAEEEAKKDADESKTDADSAVKKAESTAKDAKEHPAEYIKKADDAWKENSETLKSDLQSASDTMAQMNATATEYSEELQQDITAIQDQVDSMHNMVVDLAEGVAEEGVEYIFADISENAIEFTSQGIIYDCNNKGIVQGDSNAGGITGSMDIDTENLENNAALTMSLKAGESYTLAVITADCTNEGFVSGRNDNIGGIAGYMHYGVVENCCGYGLVESEGNNVGGLAGFSRGTVKDSYVLCSLEGASNVGGVTGSGNSIKNCVSMPVFAELSGNCGAIAGQVERDENSRAMNTESVKENYYVSDLLYGIDDISYEGVAQTMTYKELLEREDLPDAYRHLTVTFRIDNRRLGKQEMAYGSSLERLIFPEVAEKEGYYVRWEDVTDRIVNGNLVVTAEYVSSIPVVASQETTAKEHKPLGYIDGGYDEAACLSITDQAVTEEEKNEIFAGMPETYKNLTLYQVKITGIPEEIKGGKLRLYCPYEKDVILLHKDRASGNWNEVGAEQVGSYLETDLLSVQDTYLIASGKEIKPSDVLLIMGAAALLIAFVLTLRGIRKRIALKKRKNKSK
ncbi:MAG: hypothetical protein K5682_10940 [Lachnospiraceae bacterium]|nr:hypothetical protein [Lachnospiraceae bacterium]